ncbi:MAG: hypothetical protein PHG20_11175 [Geobacteraceae bacterium]|nr:hypothetical protein [Geobacteraceae bacterium]
MNAITNASAAPIRDEEYSGAEKLRLIQAVWLTGLPIKAALLMIGKVAFAGLLHGKGGRPC